MKLTTRQKTMYAILAAGLVVGLIVWAVIVRQQRTGSSDGVPARIQQLVKPYREAIAKDPDDVESYLRIAQYYAEAGLSSEAVGYLKMALERNRDEAGRKGAYLLLARTYYDMGRAADVYRAMDQERQWRPDSPAARAMAAHLNYAVRYFYDGTIPEQAAFDGFDSYAEFLQVRIEQDKGRGVTGPQGKPDTIVFPDKRVTVTPPEGWWKEANKPFAPNQKSLLVYRRNADQKLPTIAVTGDRLAAPVESPVDITSGIRDRMMAVVPGIQFSEPIRMTINGLPVAFMQTVKPEQMTSLWYQVLLDNRILTFHFMAEGDDIGTYRSQFERFVRSMRAASPLGHTDKE